MIEYYDLEEQKLDTRPLTGEFYRHIVGEHDEQWCKYDLISRKKNVVGTMSVLFENPFKHRLKIIKTVKVFIDCGDRFCAIDDK